MLSQQRAEQIDQQLWRLRLGDRRVAMVLAQELVAQSEPGGLWHAVGLFHRGWCQLYLMNETACVTDVNQAQACFERLGELARAADCMDIQAQLRWIAGEADEAVSLLDRAQAAAGPDRSAIASYLSMNLRGLCEWDCGNWDAALRSLTLAVQLAEQTAQPECLSNALANCSGFHYDMFNFELARDLSQRAWGLSQGLAQTSVWWTAGINAMLAHDALGDSASAWQIGQQLLAHQEQMPARKRVSYFSKFSFVALHAGAMKDAQHCMAEAERASGDKPHITELVWAQAQACVLRGDHAQARALAHARVQTPEQAAWADTPLDVWRMLRTLAEACKGMRDFEAALQFEEQASERYAELVGRSARAHRVVIEVQLQTQRTAWQRDEAMRQHREAQAEQQRLATLNAALDEAHRAKTRLLAVASHDLRQPLHALGMYLASIHSDLSVRADSRQQLALIERAEETVQALSGMFNTLLDLSRIDGGSVQLDVHGINLSALCQRLVQEAAARSTAPVVLLEANPGLAKFGLSDPALLERCIRNLLENALNYASGAPICLAIRSRASHWSVEVRDRGPGIAPEHIHAVFDEFYRIEQSKVRGLGLGLSIVKRLCGLMQHPLKLASQPERGTVVSIGVPKALRVVPLQTLVGAAPEGALRVALIDDDPAVLQGTSALLERWGYVVDARSSMDAWLGDAVPEPDLAVVDYHLGAGPNGVAVVQALRALYGEHLPCLIVTAETSEQTLAQIRQSAIPNLAKPMQPARLRAWLAAAQVQRSPGGVQRS